MINKDNLIKNQPLQFTLFLLGCCLLFFTGPVNTLLDILFVKPLISGFENNLFNNYILLLLSMLLGYWLVRNGAPALLFILAGITIFWYLLVLHNGYWHLFLFKPWPLLRDWDLVIAALVMPAILTLIKKKGPEADHPGWSEGFIEDLSVEDIFQDTFNRRIVAKEIADTICRTINQRAFAIGILGEYGSGKTSFINLIALQLQQHETSLMRFDAWRVQEAGQIQRDFFDQLSSKLRTLDPKISGMVNDYSRKLSRVDSGFEKRIQQISLLAEIFRFSSYTDDFEQINASLARSGKKIVIIIDDLDRLYHQEIIEVMRLIRNTANFSNVYYLLAYERSYIEEAIRSLNRNADTSFLDKIIQLEIPLPKREADDLLDMLEREILSFTTGDHGEAFRSHIISSGFRNKFDFSFEKVFRQSRDVIKFVNGLKITYTLIGQEVLFENLFVLELLKFRFPRIYDRLFDNRDEFIFIESRRSRHEQYYRLRTYKKDKEDDLVITRTLAEEKEYSAADIRLISGLLQNMFFGFDRYKNTSAISNPMYFERYFRYRLSNREVSETAFHEAWNNGLNGMKVLIEEYDEKGALTELSTRIFQQKPDSRESYELKLQALFFLGPKFVRDRSLSSFDYETLTDQFWNHQNRLDRKYYNKNEEAFNAFIDSLLSGGEFPYMFHAEVIYHYKRGPKSESADKSSYTTMQVSYFREHVRQIGLSKDALWLFWWIRYKEWVPLPDDSSRGYEYWHFENEVIPVIRDLLTTHDPFWFLKYSIKWDMRDNSIYFIYTEFLELFETPDELRTLVAEHTLLDEGIRSDYLAFFDACKTNSFSQWTEYEFKTDLKPARGDQDEY